ncbi:MAG: hypothetical protein KDB63_03415 [Nocardioidaceae bacterium]|nr:hypothetical protein [Nocardioidaceae bacterium]
MLGRVKRRLGRLRRAISEHRVLLLDYEEDRWVLWCDRCLTALDREAPDAPALVLAAFGGMGSINDLELSLRRGLRSAIEIAMQSSERSDQETAANQRLVELKAVVYDQARALQAIWPFES